jgi:hypothetical protein
LSASVLKPSGIRDVFPCSIELHIAEGGRRRQGSAPSQGFERWFSQTQPQSPHTSISWFMLGAAAAEKFRGKAK